MLDDVAIQTLIDLSGPVFVYTDPEIIDLSPNTTFNFHVLSKDVHIIIKENKTSILKDLSILKNTIFEAGKKPFCWNIKSLFSYVLYATKYPLILEATPLDLKVIGSYLGRDWRCPTDFLTLIQMARSIATQDWKNIYFGIHLPLIREVIPELENVGIIDAENRRLLHAYYEIEGQRHGRLKCPVAYSSGYNPHSILPDQRSSFRAVGEDAWFMYLDYKNMEVYVLQWLSQDPVLGDALATNDDFYSSVFELLMGKPCPNRKMRDFAKQVFLPVVYGMSAKTLSERFNISEKFAEHLINKLQNTFPVCFAYVQEAQNKRQSSDVLGRTRIFDDQFHRIRNFVVQSPGATICLEKLIDLNKMLKDTNAQLGFSVHDGYCIYLNKNEASYIADKSLTVLQAPSKYLPGLQLRATCKLGPTLADLLEENNEAKKESV